MVTSRSVISWLCLVTISANLILASPLSHGGSTQHDGLDSKLASNPSSNDLFWANRGKKSDIPENIIETDMDVPLSKYRQRRSLKVLRPNSFMNLYVPKEARGKRGSGSLRALRPNSFLFPSMHNEKRDGPLFNRPNSHLFPFMKSQGKRSGDLRSMRPNSFLFPMPKRSSTFFAGRGKKDDPEWNMKNEDMSTFFAGRGRRFDEEDDSLEQIAEDYDQNMDDMNMIKRDYNDEDVMGSFFAGRGKKSGSFFAGRGKREIAKKDADEDLTFWAVRG
ncbi:uncharacterized protein LOC131886562 [Tigriopus californicus]|nr:uncharacterized protein LOC131886562 [Tigriopus californicus]XP_059090925.1 uncharacterized protein LOC131886562 [Tigriopus californicus]XP_059090932.1 uncharacterized protein LOC131886562 [Tigriopus californicus]